MKELVEFLALELVDQPDRVRVSTRRTGPNLFIDLTAASGDVGRLIGRQGRTAEAIRLEQGIAQDLPRRTLGVRRMAEGEQLDKQDRGNEKTRKELTHRL